MFIDGQNVPVEEEVDEYDGFGVFSMIPQSTLHFNCVSNEAVVGTGQSGRFCGSRLWKFHRFSSIHYLSTFLGREIDPERRRHGKSRQNSSAGTMSG